MKNPLKISLDEIEDWEEFQDLVQAYFEALVKQKDSLVKLVRAKKSGRGSDGGRDILVEIDMHDGIQAFTRKWVVQCKFEQRTRFQGNPGGIRDLLDRYKANGYLLVCKARASAGITQCLEDLEKSDPNERCYVYWDGPQFRSLLLPFDQLIARYFPKHHSAISKERRRIDVDNLIKE